MTRTIARSALADCAAAAALFLPGPSHALGYTLTTAWGARPGAWAVCEPANADRYVWERNGEVIPGPTSAWYWIERHDAGHELRSGTDAGLAEAVLIPAGPGTPAPTLAPRLHRHRLPATTRPSRSTLPGELAPVPGRSVM